MAFNSLKCGPKRWRELIGSDIVVRWSKGISGRRDRRRLWYRSRLTRLTSRCGFRDFHEPSRFHVVDVAVYRNFFGNQRVVSDKCSTAKRSSHSPGRFRALQLAQIIEIRLVASSAMGIGSVTQGLAGKGCVIFACVGGRAHDDAAPLTKVCCRRYPAVGSSDLKGRGGGSATSAGCTEIVGIRFAVDSLQEEAGFEPSVPA